MAKLQVGQENNTPIELHYEDYGGGPPVVLIHGWPLSGRSWEKQLAALIEAGYRVITYDRRGFGQSSQPWTGYDYDTFTDDLHALLTHLDLRDATLVGFSMGGGEVVRYLSRFGDERISKAVLAGAITPYLYISDDNPDGGLDDATIQQFQDGIKSDRPAFLKNFMNNFFAAGDQTNLLSEENKLYHRHIAAFASAKGTRDCVEAFGRTDFRDDMQKITVPTLVLHGDSDAIVPFEVSGQRSYDTLANAELVIIPGGPHGFNATHAGEFNRALLNFLS